MIAVNKKTNLNRDFKTIKKTENFRTGEETISDIKTSE